MHEGELLERWRATVEAVAGAARKAGRDPADIRLIAVSKLHPPEAVQALARAGHRDFGENYIQEAQEKQTALDDPDIRWHFIGRLQSNKVKHIPGSFHLVHSIDRFKLAQALHKKCREQERTQAVLLQVNVSGETQKGGISRSELFQEAEQIAQLDSLDLQGLMCMPPFFDQGERARPFFAALRECRDSLETRLDLKLPHLSMGMSGDFVQAIAEGATLVRIGTQIFGPRQE
jgi:hypothetical protein